MPVIEQKTTNKNKVDFDLNRLDKSKTTIFSKYPFFLYYNTSCRNAQGKSGEVFQEFMGALRAGRHCSAGAAGSAVRTVVTQQKANCRAE